jgi:hypothetical protein
MEPVPESSHLFTLEEANRLIPRVRELLLTLQDRAARLGDLQERLNAFRERKRRPAEPIADEAQFVQSTLAEAQQLSTSIQSLLEEIEKTGCELKDIQMGLIDFRAEREGRTVYLCWRLGEDDIRYWHELHTGFSGRQPLD